MLGNDVGHLWFELNRREEALAHGSRYGWVMGIDPRRYDSMGRTLDSRGSWHRDPYQLSRVERVRSALYRSQGDAIQLLRRQLSGLDVSAIAATLVDAAQDVALIYGSSVVAGAFVGGAGGALVGGMGAVPGAGIGMTVGIKAGTAILAFLGLKSLIEDLGGAMPEALRQYALGFDEAWGPVATTSSLIDGLRSQRSTGNVNVAASYFAQGHAILVIALLSALAAYLLRGAGNKAVALSDIRASSRLGPKVSTWVEQHADDLARHPRLQPRQRTGAGGDSPPPPPPQRPRRGDEEPGRRRSMPTHRVRCFDADNLPRSKVPEFERQLAGQQTGLNNLTVDEYLKGREAFAAGDAVRNPAVARTARSEFERNLALDLAEELQAGGTSPTQAKAEAARQAAEKMKTLAALHNPDLVSGGKDVIADFGDRQVNSSIGAQWKSRIDTLDEAAKGIYESQRSGTQMNAKLDRCP
jgi:Novel toxin 15